MAGRKFKVTVDARTEHLSDEALICRRYGHRWTLKAMSRRRFQELIKKGQMEDDRYCDNGCGGTWRQLWNVRNGQVIENERHYPSGGAYLLPSGSGRLHRDDARVAQFARDYAAYI